MSISLPNVRKLFIPDEGYTLFDADLSGADAQVVAWEADDLDLKDAFKSGVKIHIKNAQDMFPEKVRGWSSEAIKNDKLYKEIKQGVHGTNYGASSRTLAQILNWTQRETEHFQSRWFSLHPGIRLWHNHVEMLLRTKSAVSNKFGYTRTYFDRVDALLPQALAWIPQSTVALVTFEGALAIRASPISPYVQFLAQVHDSLVFQIRTEHVARILPEVKKLLHQPVPYADPLTIPWGLAASTKSWGDIEDIKWPS